MVRLRYSCGHSPLAEYYLLNSHVFIWIFKYRVLLLYFISFTRSPHPVYILAYPLYQKKWLVPIHRPFLSLSLCPFSFPPLDLFLPSLCSLLAQVFTKRFHLLVFIPFFQGFIIPSSIFLVYRNRRVIQQHQ